MSSPARGEAPGPAGWDPAAEFRDLHDRMGQLVARAFGDGARGPLPPWLPPWSPPADVSETGDSYVVEVDLPGTRREHVHVEVRDQDLVVTGEFGNRERGHPWRRSRPAGQFECRVTLPMATAARPRQVQVTGG